MLFIIIVIPFINKFINFKRAYEYLSVSQDRRVLKRNHISVLINKPF